VAKVKNVSGEARTVPAMGGRLVLEGQVLEVPDELVETFTDQESVWAPVKSKGDN
jgi:hypothetical protein